MLQTKTNHVNLLMAPLQGFTDNAYRKAYATCFTGIDEFYAPYISLSNNMQVEGLDDLSKNLQGISPVPQILAASMAEFKILMNSIVSLGFIQLNLNMGCPYPMVTRKGRGAALIRKPDLVQEMLDYAVIEKGLKCSIKVRSGVEKDDEIFFLLKRLKLDLLDALIIHPRTALQQYRGMADTSVAVQCVKSYPGLTWIYNGDIVSYDIFKEKQLALPEVHQWMLGRGLLENPFLPWQIKAGNEKLPEDWEKQLVFFMDKLLALLLDDSHDVWHALNRARIQLSTMLNGFPEFRREKKFIVKCKSMEELEAMIGKMKSSV